MCEEGKSAGRFAREIGGWNGGVGWAGGPPGRGALTRLARLRGVKPFMAYARGNYAHLRVIEDTVAADGDTRSWDFHEPF